MPVPFAIQVPDYVRRSKLLKRLKEKDSISYIAKKFRRKEKKNQMIKFKCILISFMIIDSQINEFERFC